MPITWNCLLLYSYYTVYPILSNRVFDITPIFRTDVLATYCTCIKKECQHKPINLIRYCTVFYVEEEYYTIGSGIKNWIYQYSSAILNKRLRTPSIVVADNIDVVTMLESY